MDIIDKKTIKNNVSNTIEMTIKQKLVPNQIFENGLFQLITEIGVKNLGLKNQEGKLITTTDELKGSKRKRLKEFLNQYIQWIERPDLKRYAIQITEIYEEPKLTMTDGRGKHNNHIGNLTNHNNGFYLNRLTIFAIAFILRLNDNSNDKVYANVTNLAFNFGLINREYIRYKSDLEKNLLEINEHIINSIDMSKIDYRIELPVEYYMVQNLYNICNNELQKIVFRILSHLKNKYSVISYKENFCIISNGNAFTSNEKLTSIIKQAQKEVLGYFDVKSIKSIYVKKKTEEYYEEVVSYINDKYDFDWEQYYSQIEITIEDLPKLQQLYKQLKPNNGESCVFIRESNERLTKRITQIVESNFNKIKKNYNDKRQEYKDSLKVPDDVKDWCAISASMREDIDKEKEKLISKALGKKTKDKEIFLYPDYYLDIQKALIDLLIRKS